MIEKLQEEAIRINIAIDAGGEIEEILALLSYGQRYGMPVCLICGEDAIDGYCGCEPEPPNWDMMLNIARQDYATGNYDFNDTFIDFLRWKAFPPEIIAIVQRETEK